MTPLQAKRNLRLLYAFWFMREFHLWLPVWVVFLTENQGFSLTDVTLAEALFMLGIVTLEVPTGAVADRWGRSRSLGLGALALGGAILIFAFTTSFPVLITSFLLWSVADSLMSGADMALLFDTLKEQGDEGQYERLAGRGVALAWGGAGVATLLGGPVAALFDIHSVIVFGALTCLLTGAVAFALREPAHHAADEEEEKASYLRSIRLAFDELWHLPELRAVVLLTGAGMAAVWSVGYLIQPYLLDRGVEIGVLFSLLQVPTLVAAVAGALLAARLSLRGAKAAMLLIPVIGGVGFSILATAPGLTAYALLPLLYMLVSGLEPLASGYVNRRVRSERRATVLSMHNMVAGLLMAMLAPTLGFVTDTRGLSAGFGLAGLACFVAAVVFGWPLVSGVIRREPDEPGPVAPAAAEP